MVRIGIAFFAPTRCEKMGRMRGDLPAMPEMVAAPTRCGWVRPTLPINVCSQSLLYIEQEGLQLASKTFPYASNVRSSDCFFSLYVMALASLSVPRPG
jgi:hypothetical protein